MRRPSIALICTALGTTGAAAQVPLDRADPAVAVRQEQDRAPAPQLAAKEKPVIVSPAATSGTTPSSVVVGAVHISGADDIAPAAFMPAISAFIGHRLSPDDLRDMLAAISGVARAKGLIFAHSSVPAQSIVAGVLQVRLDEGRIDEVRLTGAQSPAVAQTLRALIGHAATRAMLERQLVLAQDIPGTRLGSVSYRREGEKGILVVPVTIDRASASVSIDNWGNRELGPVRAQAAVQLNGLLGAGDALLIQGVTTPLQPRELNVVAARYSAQLNSSGTTAALSGSYARSRSGGFLRRYDDHGSSYSAGVSLTQPLVRTRKTSLWLSGEFDYIASDEAFGPLAVRRDRVALGNISLNGFVSVAGGLLRAGANAVRGFGVLGATQAGDPLASRPEAGGKFTLFQAWSSWTGDLRGPFSARLATSAQVSTAPLLAVEQISIGGPTFGRAYDFSERSGDNGVLGSAELQAKLLSRSIGLLRWVQIYGFADAGTVSNHRNSYGSGDLYSAGGGIRTQFGKATQLGLEAAFPINQPRFDSGDFDPRLSFTLSASF